MANIKPRPKWILINPEKKESKVSEFGIISPDTVEEDRKAKGKVLVVGEGVEGLSKGDTVIFGAYCGEELTLKEKGKEVEYKFLHTDDILGILIEE